VVDFPTENHYLAMKAWSRRNSPSGQFHNETIASHVIADSWEEGSHVHFLGPDKSGIYSLIDKHIPNEIIRFKHIGKVEKGKELPLDDETKKWSGATEIYKITEGKKINTLIIEIEIMDEHLESMTNTFSKALEKVKNNCS